MKCQACKKEKDLNEFNKAKQNKSGYRGVCRPCTNSQWCARYNKNKAHYRLRSKLWAKNNPEKKRDQGLKSLYGITLVEYTALQIQQEYKCFICKIQPKKLIVDHCHMTGEVRGLLCFSCNSLLGFAKDKIQILQNAKDYLNDFSEFKRTGNKTRMDPRNFAIQIEASSKEDLRPDQEQPRAD